MDISILAVGKLRPYYRQAVDDYTRRLRRYARLAEHEVREASRAPSVAAQLAEEAGRLADRIPERSTLVALSRDGSGWSSADLARQLERWLLVSQPLALAIGGSHGLDASLLARASSRWSLGPLTLPHELARVLVVEQLYRAFTILRGEPYHKGSKG
ncbi:MAG TPA: 23S rRNA (pseudouridine(1915)-N(3))-methyltransferase RlmH [Gemmatimonadales bacterium]|nr:23S rRNA (pseudouridine(1915)-N(3))-methyltransferase RlmH [Gemmatimonadales bacterium]